MFLKNRGIEIDSGMFNLQFNEPQNFGKYRQIELDNQLVNIFNQVQALPYISKRFAMTRYLKLSEEEIYENQRLWAEENKTSMPGAGEAGDTLGAVGGAPMPTAPQPVEPEGAGPEAGGDDIATGAQSPLGGDTGGGETAT